MIEGSSPLPTEPTEPTNRLKVYATRRTNLKRTQHRFRRACDQIVLLNRKMDSVLYRYHEARNLGNRSFRYKLRLRLAVVEGIRNMFYEYANRKAIQIVNLRRDLFGEIVEIVSDNGQADLSDDDMDDFDYDSDDSSDEETTEVIDVEMADAGEI